MIALTVWWRTATGDSLRAGEIRVADPDPRHGGRLQGEFRYDRGYLEAPPPWPCPWTPSIYPCNRVSSPLTAPMPGSMAFSRIHCPMPGAGAC